MVNNLKAFKDTPSEFLKNITVHEISERQLFEDINTTAGAKKDAFNIKAQNELNGIKNDSQSFNQNAGLNNAAQQATNPYMQNLGTGGNNVNLGSILDAELATKLLDNMVPLLFVLILRFGVGIKVNKSELQATLKERETLHPVVAKCLDSIQINLSNPWHALLLCVGVIYSTKAAEIGTNKFLDKKEMESQGFKEQGKAGEVTTRNPRGAGRKPKLKY